MNSYSVKKNKYGESRFFILLSNTDIYVSLLRFFLNFALEQKKMNTGANYVDL